MFLWLSELLRHELHALNVFRYVTTRSVGAAVTAFVLGMALYPWFIRQMQARRFGQVVRRDGPESHLEKQGTPTMGGLVLLASLVASLLLWGDLASPLLGLVMIITLGYGVLGFFDDWLKIREQNSKGVSERVKLVVQLGLGGAVFAALYSGLLGAELADLRLYVPFVSAERFSIELPWWCYAALATIAVAGMSNAVNFTDGLDALAIGPIMIAAAVFGLLCYLAGATFGVVVDGAVHRFVAADYLLIPAVPGISELVPFAAALVGGGLAFLWFNAPPAKLYMGDAGALALGGALGAMAVLSKNELLTVIIGGLFIVEMLSVIVQRYWYKATGRRVLRMAPIHHHFEQLGWAQTTVTLRFWIVSLLLALVGLASLKLR
jgi:phospho-N-acetylmuramoyl-pentapeptide-transferase